MIVSIAEINGGNIVYDKSMLDVPTVNINWVILLHSIGSISLDSDNKVHGKTMLIVSTAKINSAAFWNTV